MVDTAQKNILLFPKLCMHPPVIDFWLSNFLFPKEAKEFNSKLSTSAWDLCVLKNNLTTGFSGTKDSKFLPPVNMNYHDLPVGTSGKVMKT